MTRSEKWQPSFILMVGILFFALIAFPTSSPAGTIGLESLTISISLDGFDGDPWVYSPAPGELGTERTFENILGSQADVVIAELMFDPDPFVLNNVLITNTTSSTQIYTVGIALPTVFPAPNSISGNVLTGVIDGGGDPGATVAAVSGFPIYSAQIDFGTVATLQNDPFSVVAPERGSASSSATFGPMFSAVPVTSSIGIQLRFSLTAGDTSSILSRFDVVESTRVPEPASLGLSILGFLMVAAFGRRRSR